jgi:hypothetical protein
MLDWLSNDQRASYAESSQIIDAPQTPAPVFAYRALKSVLFGSYDDDDGNDNEKENIPLQTRGSKVSFDAQRIPLNPKSSTPTRPSPRRMLSPAKSILRTPGLLTPRKQNSSVKFKDIKQTSMNLSTIIESSVAEDNANVQNADQSADLSSEPQASKETADVATKAQNSEPEALPETYYNVKEIDSYITATEREMKKLVRYGQRMREYARLSHKENAVLKRELDSLRNENERLRHRDDLIHSQEKAGHTAKNYGLFDLSSSSKQAAESLTGGCPREELKANQTSPKERGHHPPQMENAETVPQTFMRPKAIRNSNEQTSCPPHSEIEASTQRIPATAQARVASRTQLPPERLAAAKARLRVKSEERRKILNVVEQAQNEEHGSSALEWQNL